MIAIRLRCTVRCRKNSAGKKSIDFERERLTNGFVFLSAYNKVIIPTANS